MSQLQIAYVTAREIYARNRNTGTNPDAVFGRIVGRLTVLYPDIAPLRIREIATLAMV